jgi:hypothetical protein
MDVSVVDDFSIIGVVEILCDKFQRRMNVAFAERSRESGDIKWKTMVTKEYPENELLAFEFPDCPPNSIFVPVKLLVPTASKDAELDTFFLVEVPNQVISNSDLQKACAKRFASFFEPQDGGIDDEKLRKLKTRLRDTKGRFQNGEIMKCTIIEIPGKPNDVLPGIATQRVNILLNPDVIAARFRWDLLRNWITDVQMSTQGKRITKTTLADCLENFALEEVLDMANKAFCPHCREFVRAAKKMDLWTVPELLIIQLKRFLSKGQCQKKLELNVEYPDEFDISPFVLQRMEPTKYRLVAVIEHSGGLGGGHYIADVFHHQLAKWFRFNDDTVKAIKQNEVHSERGYVLFYEKSKT